MSGGRNPVALVGILAVSAAVVYLVSNMFSAKKKPYKRPGNPKTSEEIPSHKSENLKKSL